MSRSAVAREIWNRSISNLTVRLELRSSNESCANATRAGLPTIAAPLDVVVILGGLGMAATAP
jgi:hypothetical protein